jgi:hypothetical protein
VAQVTAGGLGGGEQLGLHGFLAYQSRKHSGHHWQQ